MLLVVRMFPTLGSAAGVADGQCLMHGSTHGDENRDEDCGEAEQNGHSATTVRSDGRVVNRCCTITAAILKRVAGISHLPRPIRAATVPGV